MSDQKYKVRQRVEAQKSNGWYPAEVVGFSKDRDWVFVKYDGGEMDVWWQNGWNIRPLPDPPAPFEVGQEVEVELPEGWKRYRVTNTTGGIISCETDSKVVHIHPNDIARIRPYTPPKTRRVALTAEELLGMWVSQNPRHIAWCGALEEDYLYTVSGRCFTPQHAMEQQWQWSNSPAGPWLPCWKEEKVKDE